jgi:hypothetical protein
LCRERYGTAYILRLGIRRHRGRRRKKERNVGSGQVNGWMYRWIGGGTDGWIKLVMNHFISLSVINRAYYAAGRNNLVGI